jgi:hypothetical protein
LRILSQDQVVGQPVLKIRQLMHIGQTGCIVLEDVSKTCDVDAAVVGQIIQQLLAWWEEPNE